MSHSVSQYLVTVVIGQSCQTKLICELLRDYLKHTEKDVLIQPCWALILMINIKWSWAILPCYACSTSLLFCVCLTSAFSALERGFCVVNWITLLGDLTFPYFCKEQGNVPLVTFFQLCLCLQQIQHSHFMENVLLTPPAPTGASRRCFSPDVV